MNALSNFPLVSIITVNYNNTEATRQFLESVTKITYPNVEVIIVDNGSENLSCDRLMTEFPFIQLIRSSKNLGLAAGNNRGIQASTGELILLINNDTEVTQNFLEPMVREFLTKPNVGMVSPRILYHTKNPKIQYAGSAGINQWTGRGSKIGHMEHDRGQYDYVSKTELVHGACMMLSRKVLSHIGMMPEEYFLYYEEHDWAASAKRAGYSLYYVGTSKIYHKASSSVGCNSPLQTYYMTRNRLLYLRRNVSGLPLVSALLVFFLGSVPWHTLAFLLKSDFQNMKAFIEGILWHLNKKTIRQPKIQTSQSW